MRGPIGIRIRSRRHALELSQAELARRAGISASYLNLIESNKREVGGTLLKRIADHLEMEVGELSGEAEHRLVDDLQEALADPVLAGGRSGAVSARNLVATNPAVAIAIVRLYRAYLGALASAEGYADRLRADPLLAELLHQVLSGITAVRSASEIIEDVGDLKEHERRRFQGQITREARNLTDVARNLIAQFDSTAKQRRSVEPARELDDLIFEHANYFADLEEAAHALRAEIEAEGAFGEAALICLLGKRFGVKVERGAEWKVDALGFPGQYHFDLESRVLWFQTGAVAATRQFQLTRLLAELSAGHVLEKAVESPVLTSRTARRLAYRALGSYLAGAIIFPYERFLADAQTTGYDIEALRQIYTASFEQVAHRLVTLRKSGAGGIPFGFLRSDPAGRLTKHFPLPGLLLPSSGHACPLWAIYNAFRSPDTLVRQVVRFADGSRYLFIARAGTRRPASYADHPIHTSVMLACNVLHADRTIYSRGLNLADSSTDIPVGPGCRLCPRRDCAERQEEMLLPGGDQSAIRAPLVPRGFDRDR